MARRPQQRGPAVAATAGRPVLRTGGRGVALRALRRAAGRHDAPAGDAAARAHPAPEALRLPGVLAAPRQRATAGRGRRRGHGRGQGRRAFAGAGEGRLRHGLRGHARRDGGEARRSIQY